MTFGLKPRFTQRFKGQFIGRLSQHSNLRTTCLAKSFFKICLSFLLLTLPHLSTEAAIEAAIKAATNTTTNATIHTTTTTTPYEASIATPNALNSLDGREEAYQFCNTLTFNSYIEQCLQVVRQNSYFKISAIQMCHDFSFTDEKLTCIRSIAGKDYADFELTLCRDEAFTSDKLKCLQNSGVPHQNYPSDPPLHEIRARLVDALRYLRGGQQNMTDRVLVDLINRLPQR